MVYRIGMVWLFGYDILYRNGLAMFCMVWPAVLGMAYGMV